MQQLLSSEELIRAARNSCNLTLVVGGGIRMVKQLEKQCKPVQIG